MHLLLAPGFQILPCASQHSSAVNINGNGNRRRLLPAPGAGRADEWGRGLLHGASQLSAHCLQPPDLSPVLDKAPQAQLHTASPRSRCLPTANSALKILCWLSAEEKPAQTQAPYLPWQQWMWGGTTLPSSTEILFCRPLQQRLCMAAPSHYQAVINTKNEMSQPQ